MCAEQWFFAVRGVFEDSGIPILVLVNKNLG